MTLTTRRRCRPVRTGEGGKGGGQSHERRRRNTAHSLPRLGSSHARNGCAELNAPQLHRQRPAGASICTPHRVSLTLGWPQATVPGMNTARRHLVPLVALLGCGPTTINVTTTGEGEAGEASTTDISSGSTGLGGSASGHVDTTTHTGAESDGGTDGGTTTTGDGSTSSSSGEPPPVCLPDECCPFEQPDGSYACFCAGSWVEPAACGCFDGQAGCECPGFEPSEQPCLIPPAECVLCFCDGVQAPLEACA